MTEKDYSLLRPFDLDAAKAGAEIVALVDDGTEIELRTFVTGPDRMGYYVVSTDEGVYRLGKAHEYRMAPLCWVEGKPVYPGDVLERENGKAFIPDMVAISGELRMLGEGLPSFLNPELLRWPRPKPVKRWINIYPAAYEDDSRMLSTYREKEQADAKAGKDRIACIEIELPPLPAK